MQFLALTALALTLIGRCLAEPIPLDAIRRDDLEARAPPPPPPPPPPHQLNPHPPPNLKEFWPCLRCSIECTAVVVGCGVVCGAAEIDGPLCGLCIAGAGGSKACVECWPRCRGQPGMPLGTINGRPFQYRYKPVNGH